LPRHAAAGAAQRRNNGDLLGIIEEDVPKMTDHGCRCRIWAGTGSTQSREPSVRGIEDGAYFYFAHAMPVNVHHRPVHYGEAFTAAVQKDNFLASSSTRNAPAAPARSC
jgi:glutamine amidotransferase